jgi:hypothetical protein
VADNVAAFYGGNDTIDVKIEPQIAQAVTLIMASRGCSILGSGTLSQRISPLPCQVIAFIRAAPDPPFERPGGLTFASARLTYESVNAQVAGDKAKASPNSAARGLGTNARLDA